MRCTSLLTCWLASILALSLRVAACCSQAESYVIGMLTNLETLPFARVHNMLKMFLSSEDRYEYTEIELRRLLTRYAGPRPCSTLIATLDHQPECAGW